MAIDGWIATSALAEGGTGHGQLNIITAQIADSAITAAKLAAGAATVGKFGVSTYGGATYG